MVEDHTYRLLEPEQLITPCVLVYPELIRANLEAAIRIAGNVERLRPHVKTHKTPQIVKIHQDLGIHKFKCATLCEADMLGTCSARHVLVAYPQVGPAIARFSELIASHPHTTFATVVDGPDALEQLNDQLCQQGQKLEVLLDIDNGMHRTGVPAGPAAQHLYRTMHELPAIVPAGLHVYDGQNHQPSRQERDEAVDKLMKPVLKLVGALLEEGLAVPKLVCGGTPTFPVFAALANSLPVDIELSPGTCVLSDFNYGTDYPDIEGIRNAAVLMTRVISKQPGSGEMTLDLGNKAVAADPPAGSRCHFLDLEDALEVKQNEEHLIIRSQHADSYQVGDVLYALPAHICPTMALHRFVHAVQEGRIVDSWEVTARDRIYN